MKHFFNSLRPSGQNNSLFIQSDSMTHGDLYDPAFPHPSTLEKSASSGEKPTVALAEAVQNEASVADRASLKVGLTQAGLKKSN